MTQTGEQTCALRSSSEGVHWPFSMLSWLTDGFESSLRVFARHVFPLLSVFYDLPRGKSLGYPCGWFQKSRLIVSYVLAQLAAGCICEPRSCWATSSSRTWVVEVGGLIICGWVEETTCKSTAPHIATVNGTTGAQEHGAKLELQGGIAAWAVEECRLPAQG